jgi:hypothetical protein
VSQKQKNPDILDLNYDPFGGQWEIYDGPFMVATTATESYARLMAAAPALLNLCNDLLSGRGGSTPLPENVYNGMREVLDFMAVKVKKAPKKRIAKKPAATRSPVKKKR